MAGPVRLAVVAAMGLIADARLLGALLFVVLEALAGFAAHHKGYVTGKAEIQAVFDKYQATQAELALRAQVDKNTKEAAMRAATEKVSQDYESLKTATGLAVGALDADRMRLQAALAAYRHSTGTDTAPAGGIDDAAAFDILAGCIDRRVEVADQAAAVANKLISLQTYVRDVCLKQSP